MGRGGGRSKASSTGTTHEAGTPYIPIDLNTTLIEFILSGHFETDYFSYCSTRLSGYTCRYWFDPSQPASQTDFDTHVFEEGSQVKGALGPIETHSDMLMHFANPAHFPVSLTGGIVREGWDKHPNDSTLLINDLLPLTITKEKQVCSTLLCIALFVGIFANMFSCHCLRRISDGGLYIAKILQYLTILECIDLFIQLGNTLIDLFRGVPLLTVINFIGKWSCQTLAMGYTSFVHSEGLLFSALAGYSLLFLKKLRYHLARFRGDWTFNFLMLVIALTATASSQFFYTFDLFHVDNRLPPSKANIGKGIFVEPSLYMCGFSASWGLSHVYVSYIWPMIDHLQGDIVPCLMTLAAGTMILINRQSVARKERKEPDLDTPDEMNEFIWILPLLFLLHGFSILPRTMFFLGKYFVFSEKNLNRIGLIFHREDMQPIGEGPIITAVAKIIPYRQISIDILPFLQNVDKALRFLPPLFQAAKACLIIFGFSKSRRILRTGLNHICGRPKYSGSNPLEKGIKIVENSIYPDNVDRYESIPFNVIYSGTALPTLESQSKVPVYANFEDVQELSV